MATYAYKCPSCGDKTEVIKPMTESDRVETCDKCQTQLERDYASQECNFQLRGTGWTGKIKKKRRG